MRIKYEYRIIYVYNSSLTNLTKKTKEMVIKQVDYKKLKQKNNKKLYGEN